MISASLHRYRRTLVEWCCCALLVLGVTSQLHGLAHAVKAAEEAAHHKALVAHLQACDECLQYAALDAALPAGNAAGVATGGASDASAEPRSTQREATTVVYRSRAPPAAG